MYLHSYRIKNFRRLQEVHINLAEDISIFVGANNSGKTSATQALDAFVSGKTSKFSMFDFSASCWKNFDLIGDPLDGVVAPEMPSIALDLWFEVESSDLYHVLPLLPSLDWQGSQVGMRIELSAEDAGGLIERFRTCREEARRKAAELERRDNDNYVPWPKNLTDYLKEELQAQFDLKYFVLDRTQFTQSYEQSTGYVPLRIVKNSDGAAILKSLLRVDNLSAQRHLADPGSSSARSEDLSKRLSKFYKRNLDQRQDDHKALRALHDSETGLNEHLADVFKETLNSLSDLGYPGVNNPKLEIKSDLNPVTIMSSQDARVHYVLGDDGDGLRLPDTYNGLGFKNLIYMVVEILDLHNQWIAENEKRALLHLIFVEEPEAHLHAQLQQVFVRNILKLVHSEGIGGFKNQIVITTHSPHILYERGFKPIRYFRRLAISSEHTTEVLNLSDYYNQIPDDRDFLERYLKLTHCDLFFADAAILVEGNVERLLLPIMIEKEARLLRSTCLSILEVGGAFGHRFKSLIEFLGLCTLIITDIDSVAVQPNGEEENQHEEDDEIELEFEDGAENTNQEPRRAKKCLPSHVDAVTSNQALIRWLPGKSSVSELLQAAEEEKIFESTISKKFKVRVAYQVATNVRWGEEDEALCGRTFEESFGLENANWCQGQDQKNLGLKLRNNPETPAALALGLHKRVSGKSFDKTKFALGVLAQSKEAWIVPHYIKEGLHWLVKEVSLEMEEENTTAMPSGVEVL